MKMKTIAPGDRSGQERAHSTKCDIEGKYTDPKITPWGEIEITDDLTSVTLVVPTYMGDRRFTLAVEADADGDWRVYLPDTDDYDESNGIVYLGSPEEQS